MHVNVFSIKKAASGHVDWHNMWSRNLRWYRYDRASQKFKYEWWLRTNEFKKSDYNDRSAKNRLIKSINCPPLINFENWNTHIYLKFGMMIDGFDRLFRIWTSKCGNSIFKPNTHNTHSLYLWTFTLTLIF